METILQGDCHHLECCDIYSDLCLKRYFTFFNPNTFEYIRYGFCNDFIRLELMRREANERKNLCINSRHWFNFSYKCALEDYLLEFAGQKFGLGTTKWGHAYYSNNRLFDENPKVNFMICQRPYLYASVNIRHATQILLESIERDGGVHSGDFFHSYMNTITTELNKLLKYKKYKHQHDKCTRIISRFNRHGVSKWQDGIRELIELISEFFNLKINKHESSKQQEPVSIHL